MLAATHSGPFHADDVLAWALLRLYADPLARLVRTRDPAVLASADVVFDVGGVYDPETRRFDHHQADYTGPLSSAGMVLSWLEARGHVDEGFARELREQLVDYVDDVDNGRRAPERGRPCFASIVESVSKTAAAEEEFDPAFFSAADLAATYVRGIDAGYRQRVEAVALVSRAMEEAARAGRRVLFLDAWCRWKEPYFANDGSNHPTDYVLFPSTDGSWRVVAIPPRVGSMAQKRPLPEAWAGLTGEALEQAIGVRGARFCHKNRFIAVFDTREAAVEALERHGML